MTTRLTEYLTNVRSFSFEILNPSPTNALPSLTLSDSFSPSSRGGKSTMVGEQSSTVARFIQRFREAQPASPRQRHRDRAAMDEQFWWTRSSQDSNISYPSVSNNWPSGDMEERQGLESQRAWDGAEENENPRVVQQGSVFAGRKSLGPLMPATQHTSITDRGDEDVPGWSPMPSPPSPGPPGPPPSDEDDESHTAFVAVSRRPALEGELQGSDPISSLVIRCSHTSSQEGTAGEDAHDTERNKFQDLDVRASTLLERCRELLAAPLAASGQVSTRAESNAGIALGDEGEVKVAGGVVGEFSDSALEALEQRARALLGDTEPLDHHAASDIAGLPWTCDSEISLRRCQQRQSDYPAWNKTLDRSDAAALAVDRAAGPTLPRHARGESRSENSSGEMLEGRQRGANFLPKSGGTIYLPGALETLRANTDGAGLASQIGKSSTNGLPFAFQTGQSHQGPCFAKAAFLSDNESVASGADWVACLEESVEDPVVKALLQRADHINSELLRRDPSHC